MNDPKYKIPEGCKVVWELEIDPGVPPETEHVFEPITSERALAIAKREIDDINRKIANGEITHVEYKRICEAVADLDAAIFTSPSFPPSRKDIEEAIRTLHSRQHPMSDTPKSQPDIVFECPFCGKKACAWKEGWEIMHETPTCTRFDELPPDEYLKAVRIKLSQ